MKWKKYAIATTASAEDVVVAILNEYDITATEVIDKKIVPESVEKEGGFYEELMPDLDEGEDASVIFYLDEDADDTALLSDIRGAIEEARAYADIGDGTIAISLTDEADWRDKWKEYFHAFTIGDILIRPSWEKAPKDVTYDSEIVIDPGISFGTGQHETTRMCIEALAEAGAQDERILDIGCGSGILSVAAVKLGAAEVVGTDIDADCMTSVEHNFALNGLSSDGTSFYVGDLTNERNVQEQVGGGYDIILANILADVIIGMTEQLQRAVKPGGLLILSGIIDFKEEDVRSHIAAAGFRITDVAHRGEWVCLCARAEE